MKHLYRLLLAALLGLSGPPAMAVLKVFASVPEWGALVTELGGNNVDVYLASSALQDPDFLQAKPSLMARSRNADLLVFTGASWEIGWLPILLRDSGNARIQPGAPGNFEASRYVRMLEVPSQVDRSGGDIHPGGNPHIAYDPRNVALVADALVKRLAELDSANAAFYAARHKAFSERWSAAIAQWEEKAAPLKGVPVVVQHKAYPYLLQWLGMKQLGTLEPIPGVEPTTAQLTEILHKLERDPAKMILRPPYLSERPSAWLHERTKIPVVLLPQTVGGSDQAKDLFGLFEDTIQRLLAALK
jgi:zinc/manganese transport system substrate-binding protein